MLVNFDCDCFYVADRAALIRTLSILPKYQKNKATESGAVIDYRDWQIPLGRRFRLELMVCHSLLRSGGPGSSGFAGTSIWPAGLPPGSSMTTTLNWRLPRCSISSAFAIAGGTNSIRP